MFEHQQETDDYDANPGPLDHAQQYEGEVFEQGHGNGQQHSRQIQPADAGDDAAQRPEYRMGGLHHKLAQRVVEIGSDPL